MTNETSRLTEDLLELRKFLDGSGDLDKFSFGERPAAQPNFWWRKHLDRIDAAIAALAPTPPDVSEREALARVIDAKAAEIIERLQSVLVEESPMHPFGCSTWLEETRVAVHMAVEALQSRPRQTVGSAWQPITTMPTDNRDVLIWNKENGIRKGRYFYRADNDLPVSIYEGDGVNTFKGGHQPTHWQPLPATPSPAEGRE